jgi:tight adherence protein B
LPEESIVLIAAATFALILAIVLGTYWVLLVRVENRAAARLHLRIEGGAKRASTAQLLLRQAERLSDVQQLNRLLLQTGRLFGPLQRAVTQSGLRVTVGMIVLASGSLAGIVYLVLYRSTRLPLVALAGGALAMTIPYLVVPQARARRVRKFEEQFPEAIDLLSRALRAGHALTTGLAMVAEELPNPIGAEFRLLHDQQAFGLPLHEALKNFARRVPLLDARFFVTAVLTQREAGGNLSEVLDNLAAIIRERFRVKRQVRVLSAHGRITGWVLGCLAPVMAFVSLILMPANYAKFYRDPLGVQMIAVALLLQVAGILIIRKIVDIEY